MPNAQANLKANKILLLFKVMIHSTQCFHESWSGFKCVESEYDVSIHAGDVMAELRTKCVVSYVLFTRSWADSNVGL